LRACHRLTISSSHADNRADCELGVELVTLEDAACVVVACRRARPHWDFAAELLLKAAETGKRRDVEAAGLAVVVMPREGAIILRDLLGKLNVLNVECDKCGRGARCRLDRLIERYGIDAKLFD
jgi:hypothetical protein